MQKKDFPDSTNGPPFELLDDTVGFSDYTNYYVKLRQIKEASLLAENKERMDSCRDESVSVCQKSTRWPDETVQIQSSTQETSESCKLNPTNSKFACARGKSILAMKKHFNLCQSKKPPICNSSTVRENPFHTSNIWVFIKILIINTIFASQSDVQQPIKDEPHFERMREYFVKESQLLKKIGKYEVV